MGYILQSFWRLFFKKMVCNYLYSSVYTTVKMLILLALGKLYYLMHPTQLKIHFIYVWTWCFLSTLATPPRWSSRFLPNVGLSTKLHCVTSQIIIFTFIVFVTGTASRNNKVTATTSHTNNTKHAMNKGENLLIQFKWLSTWQQWPSDNHNRTELTPVKLLL
jgi:hypothetical protein